MIFEGGGGDKKIEFRWFYTPLFILYKCVKETIQFRPLSKMIIVIICILVFSSNNDGTSLRTFYLKSEHYEPSLLVIKTRKGDIFGAYCSSAWKER